MYLLDETTLIPYHISRYGCYSSGFIMAASIFAAMRKYYVTSLLAFIQSILSYLNWSHVKMFSIVKIMDIMVACFILLHVTFVDSAKFRPEYQQLWYITLVILLVVFVVNETLLYYQVKSPVYNNITQPLWNNSYFSLTYTQPGTLEREYAYYRSTVTHISFIHMLPLFVIGYCVYQ